MYNVKKPTRSLIKGNEGVEGESIEKKLQRIMNNNEPIRAEVGLSYAERNEGVKAETDIRNDKFEAWAEMGDKVAEAHGTRRKGAKIIDIEKEKARVEAEKAAKDGKPGSTATT